MPDADAAHLRRFEENRSLQGVAGSSHILSCVQLLAPQGGCCPGSIPSRLNQRWAHTNIIKLGHGRLTYGPDSSDHGDTGHRALNRAKLCAPSFPCVKRVRWVFPERGQQREETPTAGPSPSS